MSFFRIELKDNTSESDTRLLLRWSCVIQYADRGTFNLGTKRSHQIKGRTWRTRERDEKIKKIKEEKALSVIGIEYERSAVAKPLLLSYIIYVSFIII